MELLIKKATIQDKNSKWNGQTCDVLIQNGAIASIAPEIESGNYPILSSDNLSLSPGWLDMKAFIGEPGLEYKEDIASGSAAAANGGYTSMAIMPSTQPVLENKGQIEYILGKSQTSIVNLLPIGALSEGLRGDNFTEMHDMQLAGAVAFSDDKKGIQKSGLIIRSLQYAKPLDALIMVTPFDKELSHGGLMNEGPISTKLGLNGIPSISEEVMVDRDLKLADYCDHRIHISSISTENSVNSIRAAKEMGIPVTCDVSIANLIWNDSVLETFDTNYKVFPPLRSEGDRLALIEGVKDGTIDVIVSDHRPETIENKFCEFDHADFGMSTIEIAFSLYNNFLSQEIDLDTYLEKICYSPKNILKQSISKIEEGENANLTLFDCSKEWHVLKTDLKSKSRNNPMIGQTLKGRVLGVINKHQINLND